VTELLDESEIWKSYSSQRHDLFIEDRPVLAIQSGTTHAGYLTQVFYPLLSISLNTHEGFDRSGKRPAAVLSKHVQFHQDHPLLSSAIFVKKSRKVPTISSFHPAFDFFISYVPYFSTCASYE